MKRLITVVSALVLVSAASEVAFAAVQFNQNVTPQVINGSGITNGSFTRDQTNAIEIGLRGKLRYDNGCAAQNTFNSNGDGTYSFAAGVAGTGGPGGLPPCAGPFAAVWSFDWSVNTDYNNTSAQNLDDYKYEIGIDYNPSTVGTTFCTFDPINPPATPPFFWDDSIGNNSTPQSGGAEAVDPVGYAALLANNNVAQNSWQFRFFTTPCGTTFDPSVDGTYDVYIRVLDKNTNAELSRSTIQIIAGAGGVPMSSTASLIALFAGLALVVSFFSVRRLRTA